MHNSPPWIHGPVALPPREPQRPKSLVNGFLWEAQKTPGNTASIHLVWYPWCSWTAPPSNQWQKWGAVQVGECLNLFTFCAGTLSAVNNGRGGEEKRRKRKGEGRWEGRGKKEAHITENSRGGWFLWHIFRHSWIQETASELDLFFSIPHLCFSMILIF